MLLPPVSSLRDYLKQCLADTIQMQHNLLTRTYFRLLAHPPSTIPVLHHFDLITSDPVQTTAMMVNRQLSALILMCITLFALSNAAAPAPTDDDDLVLHHRKPIPAATPTKEIIKRPVNGPYWNPICGPEMNRVLVDCRKELKAESRSMSERNIEASTKQLTARQCQDEFCVCDCEGRLSCNIENSVNAKSYGGMYGSCNAHMVYWVCQTGLENAIPDWSLANCTCKEVYYYSSYNDGGTPERDLFVTVEELQLEAEMEEDLLPNIAATRALGTEPDPRGRDESQDYPFPIITGEPKHGATEQCPKCFYPAVC